MGGSSSVCQFGWQVETCQNNEKGGIGALDYAGLALKHRRNPMWRNE